MPKSLEYVLDTIWSKTKKFFLHSETIFLARLQAVVGFIAGIVTYVDPTLLAPIIGDAPWFPWFVLINGFATEYLRRRRDEDLNNRG